MLDEPELIVRAIVEVVIRVVPERLEGYPPQRFDHAAVLDEIVVGAGGYPPGTLPKVVTIIARAKAALTSLERMVPVVKRVPRPRGDARPFLKLYCRVWEMAERWEQLA